MFKRFICLFLIFVCLLGLFSSNLVQAQVKGDVFSETSPDTRQINSFDLFWPIVAGRTADDSLYFLKAIKENLRRMLIFNKAKKANYTVFLSTKRVIEAEKLINEGKDNNLIERTLEQALVQLNRADLDLSKALAANASFSNEATDIVNKISNLEIFIPWLINKTDKSNELLTKILQKASFVKEKLVAPKK